MSNLFCESSGFFEIDNVEPGIKKRSAPQVGIVAQYFDQMIEEFYARFEEKFVIDQQSGCWNWIGFQDGKGYGRVTMLCRPRAAHRVSYELYYETIPDGMHLDHLCRNTSCINPLHLEPVTHEENVRRGHGPQVARDRWLKQGHCKRGHPFSGENLIITEKQRICRECKKINKKAFRDRLAPRKGPNLEGLGLGTHASVAARLSKTHCKRGHEYTSENTGSQKSGRYCKTCSRQKKSGPNRLAYLMANIKGGV